MPNQNSKIKLTTASGEELRNHRFTYYRKLYKMANCNCKKYKTEKGENKIRIFLKMAVLI
jgi:hypothetical protein